MCDLFVGIWKFVSSEKFEDYMKELGEKNDIVIFEDVPLFSRESITSHLLVLGFLSLFLRTLAYVVP